MSLVVRWIGLVPLALLYRTGLHLHRLTYQLGLKKSVELPRPVVSVGNLTAGGTGKTPFCDFFLRQMGRQGLKVTVLSRGYGRQGSGCSKVDPSQNSASFYGDEPYWLASRHPEVEIYVGSRRTKSAALSLERTTPDVFLLDDGFQHWPLSRKLDIVLLDATESKPNYRPLPLGRARESLKSLRRADVVVLTKTNLASAGQIEWMKQQVLAFEKRLELLEMALQLEKIVAINGKTELDKSNACRKPWFLISGIARPDGFKKLVEEYLGQPIGGEKRFADHHNYSPDDLSSFSELLRRHPQMQLLTTEKDAVKLRGVDGAEKLPIWVAHTGLVPQTDFAPLWRAIDHLTKR